MGEDLTCDPISEINRRIARSPVDGLTNISVRAIGVNGEWKAVDLIELNAPSLLRWLKSRGGENAFAERTVGLLLGHRPHITDADQNYEGLFARLRDDPLMRRLLWLGEPDLSVDEAFNRIRNCFAAHRPVEGNEHP
jgi:hypothetical protein